MEYSQTFYKVWIFCLTFCLNPYSNGILTDKLSTDCWWHMGVLILILMEYSQTSLQEDTMAGAISS